MPLGSGGCHTGNYLQYAGSCIKITYQEKYVRPDSCSDSEHRGIFIMPMNYQMKIAICDDDPKDRELMLRLVSEYLDMHNYHIRIDEYHTGEAFLAADVSEYDLVILDIFMDRLTGIETAKHLMQENPKIQIIFCSTSNA